ncbi:ferric iron siderophore receptor [Novacetimonas maltaceti]|nr:TonB-dependent receptor plug domain-containing protein [Novacetimonas maltaceti]PYD58033.1 ferric iron siderophore receptor [Novacetimonas maltaceti]
MARLLLTTSLCCSVGIVASSRQAKAAVTVSPTEQTFSFSIPAQSLDGALAAFSKITHVQTVAAGELTRNVRSPGISGTLTPTAAMNVLLGGTGLSPRTSGNVIIVQKAAANITLGPVRVGGTVAHENPTGPGVGYVATTTMAGTKTDTPITEIPNSIYVVTKQLMQDQQPQSVVEALRYTPGIYSESYGTYANGSNETGGILQRGFKATQFIDGLMMNSGSSGETAFIERIEAVNGPASVMYGQTNPGGMVDISLKKPTKTPLHQVSVGFGNWGRYESTFDISDKINKSGTLKYRIAGIGVTQGTQTKYVDYHRVGVLPSISWDISPKTNLTLLGMRWSRPFGQFCGLDKLYPIVVMPPF